MLDTLQILLWSLTYVLIIVAGFQSHETKMVSMPYTAGVLNFSWELCALYYSHGFWGHVLWLGLDAAIVYFGFRFAQSPRQRILYFTAIMVCFLVLMLVFSLPGGMLISVFVIDLIMAVCYLHCRCELSPKLKITIAVTKLLGDTFAGLYYAPHSNLVGIIACIVFLCNVCYLFLCIKESSLLERYFK